MAKMPVQKPGKSKQDYGTPPELLAAVKSRLCIYDFSIDLAAGNDNVVCDRFYTEADDSLREELTWNPHPGEWAWLNPPYSDIEPWVFKAWYEAKDGAHVVMLVPSSVGSNWWKQYVDPYAYVAHLNGRLTFVGETKPYPKDCSLLFYTPWGFKGTEVWNWRLQPVPELHKPELGEN
jgi:phage N-6-adenine-methyltransferase